jgi:hypothetical protein
MQLTSEADYFSFSNHEEINPCGFSLKQQQQQQQSVYCLNMIDPH